MPAVKTRMPRPKEKSGKEAGEERMRKMLEDAFRQMQEQSLGRKLLSPEKLLEDVRAGSKKAAAATDRERTAHAESVTEALVNLGILDKDSGLWIKKQVTRVIIALETGAPWPRPAVATAELRAKVDRLIEQLADDDIVARGDAVEKLAEIGEAAVPQLLEASRSDNSETRLRARSILGVKE